MEPKQISLRWFNARPYGVPLAIVAFIAGFWFLVVAPSGTRGDGVTAEEANRQLYHCWVPPSASDVWFSSSYRATWVECSLGEAAFLDWCKSRDWVPSPITANEPTFLYSVSKGDSVEVSSGWHFNTSGSGACAWHIGTYDASQHRAYVVYIVD